ncbi:TPA: hypothetical protein SCV09_000615 [Campylobacter jejuni]|nr:hypothetical protein [Campylobacter jejuni]
MRIFYCLRNSDDQNIEQEIELIEKQIGNVENIKTKTMRIELLRNYVLVKQFDQVLKILDLFKYDEKFMYRFIYLKLQISAISNDIVSFEKNYNSLLQDYKVQELEIKNRLYVFQTALNFNHHLLQEEVFQFIEEAILWTIRKVD